VAAPGLAQLQGELMTLYNIIEDADAPPTTQVSTAAGTRLRSARTLLQRVRQLSIARQGT